MKSEMRTRKEREEKEKENAERCTSIGRRAQVITVKITHTSVTPKVHMLLHCVEFMRTHHALGRYAESQLEHCHSVVNQLLSNNHKNFISDEAERLRRCLADIALRRIQSHI